MRETITKLKRYEFTEEEFLSKLGIDGKIVLLEKTTLTPMGVRIIRIELQDENNG